MAKDKNSKKKNSFIKKFASFALAGAMLSGIGTGNLMAGNDPVALSGTSTSGNVVLQAQNGKNFDGASLDLKQIDYSKTVIGIDLGSTQACMSYLGPNGVNMMPDLSGSNICKKVKLGLGAIEAGSDNGKSIYEECLKGLFDNYPQMNNLINDKINAIIENGITISLTCRDSIQMGAEDVLKNVMESVFREKIQEVTGKNVSNIKCIITPQSVASEIAYAEQAYREDGEVLAPSGRIVTVNCGYSGFSICSGTLKNNEVALNTDVYSTGCSGEAIDRAILGLLKSNCEDKGLGDDFETLINKPVFRKDLMKQIESAKSLLVSGGDTDIYMDFFDDNDIDCTISVEDLNGILKANGVLDHFKTTFTNYVQNKLGELRAGDTIVLTGGSMRFPILEGALGEVSGGATISKRIHQEHAPAVGAVLAAACPLKQASEQA